MSLICLEGRKAAIPKRQPVPTNLTSLHFGALLLINTRRCVQHLQEQATRQRDEPLRTGDMLVPLEMIARELSEGIERIEAGIEQLSKPA